MVCSKLRSTGILSRHVQPSHLSVFCTRFISAFHPATIRAVPCVLRKAKPVSRSHTKCTFMGCLQAFSRDLSGHSRKYLLACYS